MLTISDQLAQALRATKEQTEVPEGSVFRLISNDEGKVEFTVDEPAETDESLGPEGEPLLFVSDGAKDLLGDDRMIDVEPTPEGLRLIILGDS